MDHYSKAYSMFGRIRGFYSRKLRVYLHGRDGLGWAIDQERHHLKKFILNIGYTITGNPLIADIVHSVWWNQLLNRRSFLLRFKKNILATATNEINPENKEFLEAKKFVTLWIAPNRKQYKVLHDSGVRVVYQPFYVDETVFKKENISKRAIANLLNINYEAIRNKMLIGSFQRDTRGEDLISPKWQKGGDILVEILSMMPLKDKWLLVLAGPRRHYIISECKKRRIPYYYCGREPTPGVDDIFLNTLKPDTMKWLYNLIDCYLVTSRSEGGPRAILEASLCQTSIFSTEVGMAPDILDKRCIYQSIDEAVELLKKLLLGNDQGFFMELITNNFNNAIRHCSYEATRERWRQIYESL